MKNALTNFDALWGDASETLHTLCKDTWTARSEADPGIMLLQAMAYKVLGIHYEREHLESSAHHFSPTLSPDKALTTTPISADDYRRVFLDAVDAEGHYLFRDIQIDEGKEGQLQVIYVPDDLFSKVDKALFEQKIFGIFKKNGGVGEVIPTVVAAKEVGVKFEFLLDAHAESLGKKTDAGREYNLVLAAIDRALRPPPERDAIADFSVLEGPEVIYPNITRFHDAVKMAAGKVCLVSDEWNPVEKSRVEKSHVDIVEERLAAAKEEIEGFSFVHHFAVVSERVTVDVPKDAADGDYFFYSLRKPESASEIQLTAKMAKQNAASLDIKPKTWRVAPISKVNNKIFHVRDVAPAETDVTIPTLLEMMPPAYRDDGGPQWAELVSVFDRMLKTVEQRDKEMFSFFDALTPGWSNDGTDVGFIDWLLYRVGGADISALFQYHIAHADLNKRSAAHHVELRKFLPAILETMQTRNLARYPKSPLSSLLWFAVGEGWSGWKNLKVIVLDHSHFINGLDGEIPKYLKPLHIDLITNFGNIYSDPEPAIKQFVAIVKNVIPMHISWGLVDVDGTFAYTAIDKEYRSEAEKYNTSEDLTKVYKTMPAELAGLLGKPAKGVKKYSRDGQLVPAN